MLEVAGKQGAGAALEQTIRDDLPSNVELDPREETLLKAAVQQADDIAALEADIASAATSWTAG